MTSGPEVSSCNHDPAWLIWLGGAERTCTCPACGATGPMAEQVSVRSPFQARPTDQEGKRPQAAEAGGDEASRRIVYVKCHECGSLVSPNFESPEYRDDDIGGAPLKFAKEQGAGIAVMLRPLYWIDRAGVEKFLDVGGGYGFALDAARTLFGWTVLGADPSAFARVGARELDLEIDDVYVSEAEPARGAPFDLVLATEVIEHVSDPIGFARALASCAGPSGRVLLTTPDAERITPGADTSVAMMGLAPGFHVMVFSRDGLEAVLRSAGFTHIQIARQDNSLIAAAGKTEFDFDPHAEVPRDDYAAYLRTRADALADHSDLRCGFLGRLARADTDAERWDAVHADLKALGALLDARYGIDLSAPERWSAPDTLEFHSFSKQAPFNLGVAFFVLGLERLNAQGDRRGARAAFEASGRACDAIRSALQSIGADDLEQGVIAERAAILALRCQAWEEPEAAAAQFMSHWDDETGPEEDRVETLMNLVIAGKAQSGPALDRAITCAEAWLRPVAMGERRAASSSEREALDAIAHHHEARGAPRAARTWRLAALMEAGEPARIAALRKDLAALDQVIESASARADREAVVAGAASDRHAAAACEAERMIARGPGQPDLNASERIALALHCLAFRDDARTALAFLEVAGDGPEAETIETLRAEARNRIRTPEADQAYLSELAANGRWTQMEEHLAKHSHDDPGETPPDLAFALAMFHLNGRGDPQRALDFFLRASDSGSDDISAAARAHAPECLARLERPAEAEAAARSLLTELENDGQSALSQYRAMLSTHLPGDAAKAPGTADRPS